ncbi:MAG TPA: NnrU family protein [Thermomicrobiales bacterium]|nr:NnrU family protein [Thermomicrobiales bacterium]
MRRTVFAVAGGTIVFAIVHSVLASTRMKALIEKRVGTAARDGLYRSAYTGYTVVWLAIMFWLFSRLPDRVLYEVRAPWSRVMRAGQLAGLLIVLDASNRIGPGRFNGIQQTIEFLRGREPQREPPGQGPRLDGDIARATGGAFRISRHPINLAPTLIVWLQPKMTVSWLTFSIVGSLYSFFGSIHEEMRVRDAYQERYDEYKRGTPFFFPFPIRKRSNDSE